MHFHYIYFFNDSTICTARGSRRLCFMHINVAASALNSHGSHSQTIGLPKHFTGPGTMEQELELLRVIVCLHSSAVTADACAGRYHGASEAVERVKTALRRATKPLDDLAASNVLSPSLQPATPTQTRAPKTARHFRRPLLQDPYLDKNSPLQTCVLLVRLPKQVADVPTP